MRTTATSQLTRCMVLCAAFGGVLTYGVVKSKARHQETRLEKLERKIEDQKELILNLKEEISRLQSSKRMEPNPHPQSKEKHVPVQKLLPEADSDLLDREDLDKILGTEEESVADSSHEMIHYYYEGQKHFEAGRYEEAIKNFKKFVDENPTHVYADRAQFYVFDSYFKGKEYGLAILAASLIETRHPYSFRMQETLYKKGLALVAMNQRESARTTFENLIKRYPGNPFSQNAGRELASMAKAELKAKDKAKASFQPTLLDDAQ